MGQPIQDSTTLQKATSTKPTYTSIRLSVSSYVQIKAFGLPSQPNIRRTTNLL